MIVIEQFTEVRNVQVGEDALGQPIYERHLISGRREIEVPGVVTEAEALAMEAAEASALQHEAELADIKSQIQAALVDQVLGIDVTARLARLRAAHKKLIGA